MPKGDDAIRKKKNKANRKKMQNDPSKSKVSNRVASIIAAKKRRQSGKRSQCQGMCFSLPTPENPFNDKHVIVDSKRKDKKKDINKVAPSKADHNKSNNAVPTKRARDRDHTEVDSQERKRMRVKHENGQALRPISTDSLELKDVMKHGNTKTPGTTRNKKGHRLENDDHPSKFLISCLNSIQNALRHDGVFSEEDKPLFVDKWGIEFWTSYSSGRNISESTGTFSTIERIAWMVSTAADSIARNEKKGLSFTSPFLLFLVPSQEKATKVRSVCKPLKVVGIHTVSLHTGASLDYQIHGLRTCGPQFLVSIPDRLLELVSLKAVDISGVSFLVVDGIESSSEDIKSIRQHISGDPYTALFN